MQVSRSWSSKITCRERILKTACFVTTGSSGSRIHVYRWLDSARARQEADAHQLQSLPVVKTKKAWTKKIHPGRNSTYFLIGGLGTVTNEFKNL